MSDMVPPSQKLFSSQGPTEFEQQQSDALDWCLPWLCLWFCLGKADGVDDGGPDNRSSLPYTLGGSRSDQMRRRL